jgi:hypothetical protein
MKLLVGPAVLAAIALVASACGSSHGRTVSSSGSMLGGTVQCTATIATPAQAGDELAATFTFHNVSKRPADVSLAYGGMWLLIRSPDGTTYDTRVPLENMSLPYQPPTVIAPGATKTAKLSSPRVRWDGPLRITPGCGLSSLPPVRVPVTSSGLPASESAALNKVVAATGHLLDHCRPSTSGVSVVGQVAPPKVAAPPLPARCTVTLRRENGFYRGEVLIVSPPNLRGVHIEQPYGALSGINEGNGNTEGIVWEFVVTKHGAAPVAAGEGDTTVSAKHMAPEWTWTGSKWTLAGSSRCGGSEGGNSASVVLITVCRR